MKPSSDPSNNLNHADAPRAENAQPAASVAEVSIGEPPMERPQTDRRQNSTDRRVADRRQRAAAEAGYTGPERRVADRRNDTGLERRRGPGRRRTDDRRSAEEGEMTTEQFEFVMAIETYKKLNKRMFPTWTEILEVVEQLGYRKVEKREIVLQDVPEPELFDPTLLIDEAA